MTKNASAVLLQELTKTYHGTPVVDHLSLSVPAHGCFALLGVNGAGKTTTIRMLAGLTKPDHGDAILLGHSVVHAARDVKNLIGLSMQETAVAPNLTVRENLQFMAALTVPSKEKRQLYVQESLAQLALEQVANKRAKTLSGGWQRRLSIAMAMVGKPAILFLDEPTLGLDVIARHELWQIIKNIKKHTTVILTTHYLQETEELADSVAILTHGKLCAMGSVAQLCTESGQTSFEDAFLYYVGEEGQ